jgi:hypothetical protein
VILLRHHQGPNQSGDAARVLLDMEEGGDSSVSLSDEQVAEIERRMADPNPQFLTLEEVRRRFAHRRA